MTAHVSIFHFLWFFWTSSHDVHYDSWLYSRNLWLDNGCNDWQVRVLYSSSKGFASIFNYLGQFVKFRQILVKPTAPQAPRETQLVRSISDRARSSRETSIFVYVVDFQWMNQFALLKLLWNSYSSPFCLNLRLIKYEVISVFFVSWNLQTGTCFLWIFLRESSENIQLQNLSSCNVGQQCSK